jgi:hypothetical protein
MIAGNFVKHRVPDGVDYKRPGLGMRLGNGGAKKYANRYSHYCCLKAFSHPDHWPILGKMLQFDN